MIKLSQVKSFVAKLYCDKCNGEMLPDGRCLMSTPVQYPHKCKDCGNTVNIRGKRYPCIEYKGLNGEIYD